MCIRDRLQRDAARKAAEVKIMLACLVVHNIKVAHPVKLRRVDAVNLSVDLHAAKFLRKPKLAFCRLQHPLPRLRAYCSRRQTHLARRCAQHVFVVPVKRKFTLRFAGGARTSVSYTHLDVYKRQP